MPAHTHCRICQTELGKPFIDFGEVPLANSFLHSVDDMADEERFPLAVCSCPGCGYMQLDFTVPAETLYRDYIYVSSTSETVRRHAGWLAEKFGGDGKLIVEIASNDGTVLKAFQERGARVLGIEPALNIAELALDDGIPTIPEFFDGETAREVAAEYGEADVILARHVFAHVDDTRDFLSGVKALLASEGTMWIEVPYVGELLEKNLFDTIYHEHLSYVSVGPVAGLCDELGLAVVDVEEIDLHGGSVLIGIRHAEGAQATERLESFLAREEERGYCDPRRHRAFADEVRGWKRRFEGFVRALVDDGAVLAGYGAAAKANTLLCWCLDAASDLEVIFDRSPHKHGKLTPGTHIPVVPADDWPRYRTTHMIILAWNFAEEIRAQMADFAEDGGYFAIPIPEPRVFN